VEQSPFKKEKPGYFSVPRGKTRRAGARKKKKKKKRGGRGLIPARSTKKKKGERTKLTELQKTWREKERGEGCRIRLPRIGDGKKKKGIHKREEKKPGKSPIAVAVEGRKKKKRHK